jgi:hypothetical protein
MALHATCSELQKVNDGLSFIHARERVKREQIQQNIQKNGQGHQANGS